MTYAPPNRAFPTGVHQPNQPVAPRPMPFGVLLLSLFSIIFGLTSLMMQLVSLTDSSEDEPQDINALLDEALKQAPPEAKARIEAFRSNQKMLDLTEKILAESKTISPYPFLYQSLETMLSLGLLVGGAGLFLRRNWARIVLIDVIVGGTFALGAYVYLMIPGFLRMIGLLSDSLSLHLDPRQWSARLYEGWSGIFLILMALHILVAYYLASSTVKDFTWQPAPSNPKPSNSMREN